MQARGLQVVQALRSMDVVDCLGHFQFDNDDTLDKQVNSIVANHDPIVPNHHSMLLQDGEPGLAQFMHQSVFIDFLQKSNPERVKHSQGAADNSSGQQVKPVLPGIHRRVLRVRRFHFLIHCRNNLANKFTPIFPLTLTAL